MVSLESSKLFSRMSAPELKKLREAARELSFSSGQQIFKEGDPGDGLYIVKTGEVQISAIMSNGERQVFSQVLPGDVFGEMAVLDNQPRSAGALAEGDTTVFYIPREELVNMLKESPTLSMTLVQEISGRLREFNRQYIRKVLQAERMALVGRFASSIVHDLKNPLTIISIAADSACNASSTPEGRKLAQERIGKQVERITNMVNDILEFTRGTPGSVALIPMDYSSFVKGVVEEFQPEVALKSIAIEFENEPPALKVRINPKRLSRVFYNLVHNAVDAMPEGGRIKLRFKATDNEVTTEVEDTGKGIALEIADRLFEAFATFGKPRGTGLGLSISQRIIEEHHGKMSARNQPGGGAVFSFTLPRQE
jgi:signal transduction histidine kinase